MRARRSFTIRGDATRREIASASKCVLLELWDELEFFDIDLAGLEAAVDYEAHLTALEHRRRRHFRSKRLATSMIERGRRAQLLQQWSRAIELSVAWGRPHPAA